MSFTPEVITDNAGKCARSDVCCLPGEGRGLRLQSLDTLDPCPGHARVESADPINYAYLDRKLADVK